MELSEALSSSLRAGGIRVVDVGLGPTPMLLLGDGAGEPGAVMVTGSHNPPDYNGFKMNVGPQAVLRRANPETSAGWRARAWSRKPRPGRGSPAIEHPEELKYVRADPARLGRGATGGGLKVVLGQRQWLGRRRSGRVGPRACGRARRAQRHDRRCVPGAPSPTRRCQKNLEQLIAEVHARQARYRHRVRYGDRGPDRPRR